MPHVKTLTTHCTRESAKDSSPLCLHWSMFLAACFSSPLSRHYLLPLPADPPLSAVVQVQLCRRWGESRQCAHTSTKQHMHTALGDVLTAHGLTHSRLQILANSRRTPRERESPHPRTAATHKHSWSGLATV
uniref:Secreted protein n=1 Tax=Knipowitschia caucasica TaxID=637954 RepID=A0AAV2IYF8_KNICA